MKSFWNVNLNLFWLVFWFLSCFLLSWCWDSWLWNSTFSENIYWYELNYNGKVQLERVLLSNDDLDEIVDLFQEVWNDVWYRDSLLIAKKYSQWLWTNAFVQDNLDMLQDQWLTLSNIDKTQIWLKNNKEKINWVLVEYEITEWLVNELPLLYVSQLFIPKDENMILISFITENKSSNSSALEMFKSIK